MIQYSNHGIYSECEQSRKLRFRVFFNAGLNVVRRLQREENDYYMVKSRHNIYNI